MHKTAADAAPRDPADEIDFGPFEDWIGFQLRMARLRDMNDRRDHRYQALAQLTEDVEGRSPQQLADAVMDALARA